MERKVRVATKAPHVPDHKSCRYQSDEKNIRACVRKRKRIYKEKKEDKEHLIADFTSPLSSRMNMEALSHHRTRARSRRPDEV